MGFRANVRTVSKIEYGSSLFGGAIFEYSSILDELFETVDKKDSRYNLDTDTDYPSWEIHRELLEKSINYLNNNEFKTTGDISKILTDYKCSEKEFYNDLKECLECILKEADKDNEYIILDWF